MAVPAETRIFAEDDEIALRLVEHFGVLKEELIQVVLAAVTARRDCTDDDPINAPGTFSYHLGTRAMRVLFRSKRWERHRPNGIESVLNPETGQQIVFQNVDLAAERTRDPQALSPKESGSKEFIEAGQGDLFRVLADDIEPIPTVGEVWYLCVSCDEVTGVRAELSRPFPVINRKFAKFHERIFIVRKGELDGPVLDNDIDMPQQDYDIRISRK